MAHDEIQIPFHRPSLTELERRAVLEVLDSGWITTGERTVEFEERIATGIGVRHAVAVNSATAALHLILEALRIKPGDEVIVPTYTFAACGEVVVYCGAYPRLVDIDRGTLSVSLDTIEPHVTRATKAIMVVHFGGRVAEMERILAFSRERGIAVIEDAAHALPASRDGRQAGSFGDAGAFSFYATKTVTTGEGGMIVTDREDIADRARVMRLHGISRDAWRRYSSSGSWYYEIEDAGFKYNMTDLAAAMGLAQWTRADAMRVLRERTALAYRELVHSYGLEDAVDLPPWPDRHQTDSWHLFPLRLRPEAIQAPRDEVIESLRAAGIGTSVHFIPLHHHPFYQRTYGYRTTDFPVATEEYGREISLPIYPDLSYDDAERVIRTLAAAVHKR